jgi:hypothetical protein
LVDELPFVSDPPFPPPSEIRLPLVYSPIYRALRQDVGLPRNLTWRCDATLLIGRRTLVRLRSALLSPLGNLPPIHPLIASHDRTSPYHVIPRGFQLPRSLLVDELSLILDPHFSPFLAVPLLLFLIVLTGEHSPRPPVSRGLWTPRFLLVDELSPTPDPLFPHLLLAVPLPHSLVASPGSTTMFPRLTWPTDAALMIG